MTDTNSRFAHQRLDAYRVALELFKGVEETPLPRGFTGLKDQMRRAAAAVVLGVAEGANRSHPRDKAARFIVARGECGECDAALEMAEVLRLATPSRLAALRRLCDRVAAMLTGLMRREQARADRST